MELKEFKKGIQEPVVISKLTSDLFLKTDNPSDNEGLYWFYYQTAKWKNKFVIDASTHYVMKGLKWSEARLFKAKKVLLELGLIKNVQRRSKGVFTKHYIKVIVIGNDWVTSTHESPVLVKTGTNINSTGSLNFNSTNNEDDDDNARVVRKRKVKAPINDNEQVLLERIKQLEQELTKLKQPKELLLFPEQEKITPNHFEAFWRMYPNKTDKGKAFSAWCKLCSNQSKGKVLPTWEMVRQAVKNQRKTERWADPTFVPVPTTWINQSRWLDDPTMMVTYKKKVQTERRGFGFVGSKIEYKEAINM